MRYVYVNVYYHSQSDFRHYERNGADHHSMESAEEARSSELSKLDNIMKFGHTECKARPFILGSSVCMYRRPDGSTFLAIEGDIDVNECDLECLARCKVLLAEGEFK